MDSEIDLNTDLDRQLTLKLYGGNQGWEELPQTSNWAKALEFAKETGRYATFETVLLKM